MKTSSKNAGFKCEAVYKPSNALIAVYKASEAGMDVGDKYVTCCEVHNTYISENTYANAKLSMSYPAFCEECVTISL